MLAEEIRKLLGPNSPIPDKDINRFLSRIDFKYLPDGMLDYSQCWMWKGYYNKAGYGVFCFQGKNCSVHRFMYLLMHGELDNDLLIRHSCDIPGCVNIKHLASGTHQDNTDDMVERGRGRKVTGEYNGRAVLTDAKVKQILKDIQEDNPHLSVAEIAESYNVHVMTIYYILYGRSWKYITKNFSLDVLRKKVKCDRGGVGNSNSKLTVAEVRQIRIDIKNGILGINIAKQYNVCQTTISSIKQNQTYKNAI